MNQYGVPLCTLAGVTGTTPIIGHELPHGVVMDPASDQIRQEIEIRV